MTTTTTCRDCLNMSCTTNTDADVNTNVNINAKSNANADAEGNDDAITKADVDTNANANANANTDTNVDVEANADVPLLLNYQQSLREQDSAKRSRPRGMMPTFSTRSRKARDENRFRNKHERGGGIGFEINDTLPMN